MQLDVFQHTLRETRQPSLNGLSSGGCGRLVLLAYPCMAYAAGPAAVWLWRVGLLIPALTTAGGSQASLDTWCRAVTLGIVLPIRLVIYAVRQGSRLVAGEEEWGSLGLLLSTPLKRYRLILQKFAVLFLLVLACSLSAWRQPSLWSDWLPSCQVPIAVITGDVLALFLLGLAFGVLALALGSLTGRRWFHPQPYSPLRSAGVSGQPVGFRFPAKIQCAGYHLFIIISRALLNRIIGVNMLFLLVMIWAV